MNKPFQRKDATSNAQVGSDFEIAVQQFFDKQGLSLVLGIAVSIGINGAKLHNFDLGSVSQKVLVECKAHRWTESGNVPSAKLTVWNEAMFFFSVAPSDYRKILFVIKDFNQKKNETLAGYYLRINSHLIPSDVEIWEFDEANGAATRLK
ncbi:MAG: hypothetical protein HYZ22_11000 [Chloroflexi bacterium]|nr:hypothetical protein [Chloroflexota bacterium]